MAGRTGLPGTAVRVPSGTPLVSAKLKASTSARFARKAFARPSTAFCSCRITAGGLPSMRVAITGPTEG